MKRALISVSDKTGIVPFARELHSLGFEIISTGGTAGLLQKEGVPVIPVETVTGFPEMMDGRIKTLHPKIHGGLLGMRDNEQHVRQAGERGIQWIDVVVVNLYPFEQTVSKSGVSLADAIENIDIGGPAMLRSAAKNFRHVTVVTDPADYEGVLGEIRAAGCTSLETRRRLAVKVFRRTSSYDGAIDRYLSRELLGEQPLRLTFDRCRELRYGENSHQEAMLYLDDRCGEPSAAGARILSGKDMSFNNTIDADAALEAVKELKGRIGVAVIKHTNPCGYATGETPGEALERAWAGDPVSSFGSVIACNAEVDLSFARFLKGEDVRHIGYVVEKGRLVPREVPGKFVEVIIAPDYKPEALSLLSRTKALRLLKAEWTGREVQERKTYRKVVGGILEMDRDLALWDRFQVVTRLAFDERKKALAEFAYQACKHTKSNAIVLAREYRPGFFQVLGMGAGQPNRVDSLRKLAVSKAAENLQMEYDALKPDMPFEEYRRKVFSEMVLASDAFFPFDDTVRAAAEYGIRYIIQPGGSKHDEDSIRACDELGMAMSFAGFRHFRH
ncbi:bifunctional phosphoribosylaminoimidazolecarboxamide formyltransferase/IMP cyclohydrolase [bacterium]|nr:bifunctional phosphoribosylaminoimidazolecarboxamide formyltransferase/IMP cyclohydrolase [bacterium]